MSGKSKNADRFTGFADIYDTARPSVPEYPVSVILRYLGKNPNAVVDLGCGTGLSTIVWKGVCENITGIEPSGDMLKEARKKQCDKISFVQAFSDNTGLDDDFADAVVCSQSFHWMEPVSTLKEVNRILKNGGIFATIDCDWPPVTDWRAEKAYMTIYNKVKEIEKNSPDINDTFIRYSKNNHMKNISESGYFRYTREILFENTEKCTANRFIGILLSQGSVQTVIKKSPKIIERDLKEFKETINNIFGSRVFNIDFCYRMRIGIK